MDNGWKYVNGTDAGGGSYSFTLDYALINGGSVSAGDTVQYFVVAQDAANNLGSSPAGATASGTPAVQTVNGHGAMNSFSILGTLSGTKTVGTGGDYPSLSGAGGLFAALNGSVLTGNVVVNITSDLTETGGVTLNELISDNNYPSANACTLTLQPDSATMRTISGTATAGLITLNGADRMTIDGSFGGSGRYLTFRNTSTAATASTILFINDASNNTVRNCVVEGATTSTTLGIIGFSTGTVTGNDNNLITGCQVRDLSTAAGVPIYLIFSSGSSAAVSNSGNTVSDNELFNFNNIGIRIASTGNDSWTLSGNNIYEGNAGTGALTGISMDGGGTNVITGNFIHDLLTTNVQSIGILVTGTSTTTIARNRITALNVNATTTTVYGIYAFGSSGSTLNVVNNQITLSPAASISTNLYGLYDGGNGGTVNAFHNSVVLGGTESGTRNSWASLRNVASTHTARNNLFLNLRTGGSGSHFAAGSEITGGSYTASNNVYAGTGATAANFMDFSSSGIVPVSYATWQSSTGDTSTSASNPGGNYGTTMFVNAATGDLHLVPGGNVLVNAAGTPIAGVTTDYDGDPRSATTPTIGTDEIAVTLTPFQQWAATNGVNTNPTTLGANGQANLMNFAFGQSPVVSTLNALSYTGNVITAGGLRTEVIADVPVAEFVRRKDYLAAGITYTTQFSADLVIWETDVTPPSVLADDGTHQVMGLSYPLMTGGAQGRFFKVMVSQ